MKKVCLKLTIAFTAICCGLHAAATTRTVNNSTSLPVNPGQFTTINAAIIASVPGDTILVAGSAISYDGSGITINKKIVLLGAGYNPDVQNPRPTKISGTVSISNAAASNSIIMGFEFDGPVNCGGLANGSVLANITFRRNYFANGSTNGILKLYTNSTDSSRNCVIAENIFNANGNVELDISSGTHIGLVIKDNLFINLNDAAVSYQTSSGIAQVIIDHNLFLAGSHSTPVPSAGSFTFVINARNAIISNNIFYNCLATDTGATTAATNNTYLNNITYAANAGVTLPAMPYHSNIGSGNINNANPLFTTLFSSAINIYLDFNLDNLRPQTGSPVINAGSDATNIGPTGGTNPIYLSTNTFLTGEPPIPEIKNINYISSSAVNVGTPIGIQVKAKKIN